MNHRALPFHCAGMEVRSWLASGRLFYMAVACMASVAAGPLLVSFTLGADEIVYTDVVLSSVWLVAIGCTILLGSSSTAADVESRRLVLINVSGMSGRGILTGKLLAITLAGTCFWTVAAATALGVAGGGGGVSAAGWALGALTAILCAGTWSGRRHVFVFAAGTVCAGAAACCLLFLLPLTADARALCLVLPMAWTFGAVAVFAGTRLRLPSALLASLAAWIVLFILQGYSRGGGAAARIARGVPVMDIASGTWASAGSAGTILVFGAMCCSTVCIMLLVWLWGGLALEHGNA
ncbi:MAG: hypothetical protein JW909_07460 [Planctomycetes bacterium]|nr:hypothetical protein [Planctomycetota bacterium]